MSAVWEHPAVAAGITGQMRLLNSRLERGERLIGWKLGLGTKAAMSNLGISAPLVGFLCSGAIVPSGATVALQGWTKPALEPELAIHMGRDLTGDADPEEVRVAIGGIGPAIELADLDVPMDDLEAVVAGDIFHRRVILGDADRQRSGDVSDVRIRVRNHSEEVGATDDATALTGSLVDLVAHVARWLEAIGTTLRQGQIIIAGSVIPLIDIKPGDEIAYDCDPLGRLEVRLSE